MANNKLIKHATIDEARELVDQFADRIVGFIVNTPQTHLDAAEFLRTLQSATVNLETARKSEKQPHLDEGRVVDEKWKPTQGKLAGLKAELGKTIIDYEDDVRRQRAEAERTARIAQLEAEQKERDKLEAKAAKVEKKGDDLGAEQIRDMKAAVVVVPPPPRKAPPPEPAKVKGVNRSETWSAEVRPNQVALLAAAVKKWNKKCDLGDELLPAAYWEPNQKALDKFAEKTKGAVELDGVRFKSDSGIKASKR